MNKKELNEQINGLHRAILQSMYPDSKSLERAAKALKISKETVRQARDYSKGSAQTITGLMIHGGQLSLEDIQSKIPQIRKAMLTKSRKLSVIDRLIESARRKYSEDELISWLRLLLARYEIELELGLRKKIGRAKKK